MSPGCAVFLRHQCIVLYAGPDASPAAALVSPSAVFGPGTLLLVITTRAVPTDDGRAWFCVLTGRGTVGWTRVTAGIEVCCAA